MDREGCKLLQNIIGMLSKLYSQPVYNGYFLDVEFCMYLHLDTYIIKWWWRRISFKTPGHNGRSQEINLFRVDSLIRCQGTLSCEGLYITILNKLNIQIIIVP